MFNILNIICLLIICLLIFYSFQYYFLFSISTSENSSYEKYIINNNLLNNINLNYKTIVITGSSSGIGNAFVKLIINNPTITLILLNRPSKKSEEIYKYLTSNCNNRIINIACDLTNFQSIINAVKIINDRVNCIDILINNAGIYSTAQTNTIDCYDSQIQTNFLAPALLIKLLLPIFKKMDRFNSGDDCQRSSTQQKTRIINIGSISYNIPNKCYDPTYFSKNIPNYSTNISGVQSLQNNHNNRNIYTTQSYYQQSKLALMLYSNIINRQYKKYNIESLCIHPGICKTSLFDNSDMNYFIKNILNTISGNVDIGKYSLFESLVRNDINAYDFYGPCIGSLFKPIVTYPILNKTEHSNLINTLDEKKIYNQTKIILKDIISKEKHKLVKNKL